jgi:branched-chain amino acid transport system ATP-binding protein
MKAILEVRGLSISFGGLLALDQVEMEVRQGEILSLIGPNGAGKTTVFNCLTGLYRPDAGAVVFKGRSLVGLKPHEVARAGVARTFQITRLCKGLTVLDNVLVAQHLHVPASLWDAFFGLRRASRMTSRREEALQTLEFIGLADKAGRRAEALSLGEQKRLELGLALTIRPSLMLLDEPAAGLNASETRRLDELIGKIRASGVTILLIEHDMRLVMDISYRVVVLNYGRKLAEGRPAEISRDKAVIEAYLGRAAGLERS